MFDYKDIFTNRGDLYNRASQQSPQARATERRLLIEQLNLQPGVVVCDAPAGGGYLADGIAQLPGVKTEVVCLEPSAVFAKGIVRRFKCVVAPLDRMTLVDNSVDRVGSLAGIHHLDCKINFFKEAYRILKPGGRFAVADVLDESPVGVFLNDTVDRLSETGHNGMFLKHGELSSLLRESGFVNVTERYHQYTWDFPDIGTLLSYCKDLFGLTKASLEQVHTEITKSLEVIVSIKGAQMTWSLLYAAGNKP